MRIYEVDTERSTVLVEARSTMGPIVFEGRRLEGRVAVTVNDDAISDRSRPEASLTIDLDALRSGNELYDAELRRRIDVARHPRCRVELTEVTDLGEGRYAVSGDVTVQSVTRRLTGTVEATVTGRDRLTVVGEQVLDIRDFKVASPQILLMRIYPEVRIRLYLDARAVTDETTEETS